MSVEPVRQVLLAEPHGFCAGVEMAIRALTCMTRLFEPPIYCFHEIVHNRMVVRGFEQRGVVFVDDIADVPVGVPLMLSAHGTAPDVAWSARRAAIVVDAVCPLVAKVHHEVEMRARRGDDIIYIGHAGHDEAVGTVAVAPAAVHLVEDLDDIDDLPDLGPSVALLTQTTLSVDESANVIAAAQRRFPGLSLPPRTDLCYATTNRQRALQAVADRADSVVVIGSSNSSNTLALVVAAEARCRHVVRIDDATELPGDIGGVVGVTAGASAPEELVDEVVAALAPIEGVVVVSDLEEDHYFPLPSSLRSLLRGLCVAFGLGEEERVDLREVAAACSPVA